MLGPIGIQTLAASDFYGVETKLCGRTAERHPMVPIDRPVSLVDVHATIYKALGIAADTAYVTEGRPFYVTKDGKGKAIDELLS